MMKTILCMLTLAGGCSALTPQIVDTSVTKPSNVAVYLTVDTRDGKYLTRVATG